ncbi:MAG: PH domain-containing protein [Planctomycetota bacterium]|jgi:hypothetical protein
MPEPGEVYPDKDEVLFNIKPRWRHLVLIILVCLIFVFLGFLNYYNILIGKKPDRLEIGLVLRIVMHVVSGCITFGCGLYVMLTIFFLLRGTWTLRVTPAALIYRTWFRTVPIPWRDINGIYLPKGSLRDLMRQIWSRYKTPFIRIVIRENADVLKRLPLYVRILSKPAKRGLALGRIWKPSRAVQASLFEIRLWNRR